MRKNTTNTKENTTKVTAVDTVKMTKVEVLQEMAKLTPQLKDQTVIDLVKDVFQRAKAEIRKITKDDIVTAYKDMVDSLNAMPAPVEASPKVTRKTNAGKSKTTDTEEGAKKILEVVEGGKKNTTVTNKKEDKKPAPAPAKEEKTTEKSKEMFPAVLNSKLGKLKKIEVKNVEELIKMFDEEEPVLVAYHWSEEKMIEVGYDDLEILTDDFQGFDHDLDLCQLIYGGQRAKVVYAVSSYTEYVYALTATNFRKIHGRRFGSGTELAFYKMETK